MRKGSLCALLALLCFGLYARVSWCAPTDELPEPAADAADAPPGDKTEMDRLLDMDLEQLANVDVTETNPIVEGVSKKEETLAESPGIVDVITARDIEQFGAKNLYEVLNWATSVYTTGSFMLPRNMVSIRGNLIKHEDNHVLVLINGRPFRDITLGGVNYSVYSAFPIQTIERVEVIRGPGSVLYGTNAFTGVLNIVTKNPDQPTMHVSTLAGSYGWQSYSWAGGNGTDQRGAYAGATYNRSEGWPFSATEDLVAPPPLDTETTPWGEDNVGVFGMYRNGNFTANVFAANASQETLGPLGAFPSDRLHEPRLFCDLGYLIELDEYQNLQTNFTYNYSGLHFPSSLAVLGGADNPFKPQSQSFLLEQTYNAQLTDDVNLLVGGLVDIHMGEALIEPFRIPTIPPFTEIWYGVYTQMEYQASEWLKLVGGMQANLPGEIEGGIVPRAAVIVSPDENWTGKFLYGQAFRSPYQIERSIAVPGVVFGNPELSPETIQTFDVQLAYHTDKFRYAATYFHSDFFGVVTRVGFPQTYENRGRIEYNGVELENEWELSERWRTISSVTYQDNVRDDVHNTTGVPSWMAKMGLAYHNDRSGWTVGLFDTYFSDPHVPATAVELNEDPEPVHLVSLNSRLDLNRRLGLGTGRSMELQFLIQNLLDEDIHHVEFERELINSFPAGPGRTFYGGFTMAY